MNSDDNSTQKRILHWGLGIALVFLIFSMFVSVGVIWWMRRTPAPQATEAVAPVPTPAANWSRANFTVHADNGVRQTSDKSWSIKGGRAFTNVRRKDDDSLELRFVYPFDGDFLPAETVTLVRLRWSQTDVGKLADELNITPEQLAALKSVSPATDIPVSSADKEQIRALFEDYLAGKDAATEKALADAVTEIDKKYYDRTRERIDRIATSVKAIFNQDQLAALSVRFGSRGN